METRYVSPEELLAAWPTRRTGWSYNGDKRSMIGADGVVLKKAFAPAEETELFRARLRSFGYRRAPSGLAEAFHALYGRNFTPRSYLAAGPSGVYGPWEERLASPTSKGYKQYDIISAYAWAGISRPLPDARTARPARGRDAWPRLGQTGIYFGVWSKGRTLLPPHLRTCEDVPRWVSSEELLELDLVPIEVERAIIYSGTHSRIKDALLKVRDTFTDWYKGIWRAYWGAFAARTGPEQSSPGGAARVLPNPFRDPGLAHFIDSRVRGRMADVASGSWHIYVDSVVTSKNLATGTEPGCWKLVAPGRAAVRAGLGG